MTDNQTSSTPRWVRKLLIPALIGGVAGFAASAGMMEFIDSSAVGGLDLSATVAGSGRLASYDALLIGPPLLDASGRVQTRLDEDGVPMVVRASALVDTAASEGEAVGLARKSRLVEILSGQQLKAGNGARTAHPTPTGVNHTGLLGVAEMRLLAEWIDLGGQYANDPFDASGQVRGITGLSETVFAQQVLPLLVSQCLACHQPVGSNANASGTPSPGLRNRLVLTGDAEGDFNVVLTLVSDTCTPANNALLRQPSRNPHPAAGTAALLPAGSAGYERIAAWIRGGCNP